MLIVGVLLPITLMKEPVACLLLLISLVLGIGRTLRDLVGWLVVNIGLEDCGWRVLDLRGSLWGNSWNLHGRHVMDGLTCHGLSLGTVFSKLGLKLGLSLASKLLYISVMKSCIILPVFFGPCPILILPTETNTGNQTWSPFSCFLLVRSLIRVLHLAHRTLVPGCQTRIMKQPSVGLDGRISCVWERERGTGKNRESGEGEEKIKELGTRW